MSPLFAKKEYWTWDKSLAIERHRLLLSALKHVCGAAENDTDVQASARLLEFYGIRP